MNIINFNDKKQARDQNDPEWQGTLEELQELTTAEERIEIFQAFFSGDEDRKQAIIERISERRNRQGGRA